MIRVGGNPGNKGGLGYPASAVVKQLRELGLTKGVPYLERVLDGVVEVEFVGICPHCGHEVEEPGNLKAWYERAAEAARVSVRDRLTALDTALKYGVGTTTKVTLPPITEDERFIRFGQLLQDTLYRYLDKGQADVILAELHAAVEGR